MIEPKIIMKYKPRIYKDPDSGYRLSIYNGKGETYIGIFTSEIKALNARNNIIDNPEKINDYKHISVPYLSKDIQDKIMKYFWTHSDNSDADLAEHFNVPKSQVTTLTCKRVKQHFKRVNERINSNISVLHNVLNDIDVDYELIKTA